MFSYPSIPYLSNTTLSGGDVFLFDKMDGNNIRAEWSAKTGVLSRFGTRTHLLDETDPDLGRAIPLIKTQYGDISRVLRPLAKKLSMQKVVLFFEFFGEQSFAGNHFDSQQMQVVLFDAHFQNKGIINPSEFLDYFSGYDLAKLLYRGAWDRTLIPQIQNGTLDGMTFEGVVLKQNRKYPRPPVMYKIKNSAWIDKLRNFCSDDQNKFISLL